MIKLNCDLKLWGSDYSRTDIINCEEMSWEQIQTKVEWLLNCNAVKGVTIQLFRKSEKKFKKEMNKK